MNTLLTCSLGMLILTSGQGDTDDLKAVREALTFHAPFDGGTDARQAKGDGRLHTTLTGKPQDGRPGLARKDVVVVKDGGRHGDALRFEKKSTAYVYYRAERNVAYRKKDWSGTVSFWLSLDPEKDLEPGYCDPIQITDKTWNNASFFVDFTKDDKPRHFRLGTFADPEVWNPDRRKWDDIPAAERPMATVVETPFAHDRWTHVAWTFSGFNTDGAVGVARLYLDGKRVGEIAGRRQIFTWDLSKTRIMLGLSYIGLYDDLAIFNRALSATEIKALHALPGGIGSLSK